MNLNNLINKTTRYLKLNLNTWFILSFILISVILFPNINIILNSFKPINENFKHITTYLLNEYFINTLIITLTTGVFAVIIGVSLAWFISMYDLPFRKFFEIVLILPLAIPSYICAYAYTGMLSYTGFFQTFLRNNLGILNINQKYFDIMNIYGVIFIFTISLFPYVYLIVKSFLEKQSTSMIEASRTLGKNSFSIFFKVILPISKLSIISGVSFVVLEVLNDYGVVKYFGVRTFSSAIFRTWLSLGDSDSAVKLSGILMVFVLFVLILEKIIRGRQKFSFATTKIRPIKRKKLNKIKTLSILVFIFTICLFGFIIPFSYLLYWTIQKYKIFLDLYIYKLILNTFLLASFSSFLILIAALIIGNTVRLHDNFFSKLYSKVAIMGYSVPGSVISIGVIIFFISIDNNLYPMYKFLYSDSKKLLLSSSIFLLIFAYFVRFLSIAYNSVESGFEKIGKSFYEASKSLGLNITKTFF